MRSEPKRIRHGRAECDRLRSCLIALSEAAGSTVYRCDMTLGRNGHVSIVVTAAKETSEDEIGRIVADKLQAVLDDAFRRAARRRK